jgi:hypothetical protein
MSDKQSHYDVNIRVAEAMVAQTDDFKKPDQIQAVALVSIAESLIAIAKILKEKQ